MSEIESGFEGLMPEDLAMESLPEKREVQLGPIDPKALAADLLKAVREAKQDKEE